MRLPHIAQDFGRTEHKYGTYHHQQEDGEHQHHLFGGITQVTSDNLRLIGTTVTNGEHTGEVVMNGPSKDTTQHNPQIGCRAELSTHDGTKDGACTGNVQELNHEDFPRWEHHEIYPISFSDSWRRTVIGSKNMFHKTTIQEIP